MDGFDWDDGNREKCRKHGVSLVEIEHVLTRPVWLADDLAHSHKERRFIAIGVTPAGRYAFVAYTERRRGERLLRRPISARFMHEREVRYYEQAIAEIRNR